MFQLSQIGGAGFRWPIHMIEWLGVLRTSIAFRFFGGPPRRGFTMQPLLGGTMIHSGKLSLEILSIVFLFMFFPLFDG